MKRQSALRIAFLRLFTLMLGSAVFAGACKASATIPDGALGLNRAGHFVLDNGLRVILQRRGGTRTVSMRLAVDVGHWDFPCGRQQTAHFLEHLLFSGTTDHEEEELHRLIRSHGGKWNAHVSQEQTVYEIDIFSPNADVALETLYEIMTKSEISGEDVYYSRMIVHRESGGRPTAARQWLYQLGFGRSAWSKAWEMLGGGSNAGCSRLESADGITRTDVLNAYETYYVPGNMALVVVGDFYPSAMLKRIQATFGQLPPGPAPERTQIELLSPGRRVVVDSRFSPILDSDAVVFLVFEIPDRRSPDWHAFKVLEAYLDQRVFKVLRINRGLSYSAGAVNVLRRDFGLIVMVADVYVENMDDALLAMQIQVDRIVDGPLGESEIEDIKRELIMAHATKYERNSEIAEYYVHTRHLVASDGEFVSEAERISRVTTGDLERVAREYMQADKGLALRVAPTFTHSELLLWVGGIVGVVLFWLTYKWTRRKGKRKRHNQMLRKHKQR